MFVCVRERGGDKERARERERKRERERERERESEEGSFNHQFVLDDEGSLRNMQWDNLSFRMHAFSNI